MRTQKDSVVSALKDNQTLEVRREEQLETAFNDILDAEIQLFKDQKKQLDISGTQMVLKAFDGQVGGYPYYMYGGDDPAPGPTPGPTGSTIEDPNCADNLWPKPQPAVECINPDTGKKWATGDIPPAWASWTNPTQAPQNTDADPSCNFTLEQRRKANVACAQLKVSNLLCEQNDDVKEEKEKWKKKMENIELKNDEKEADATKKMAEIVLQAKKDYEELMANRGKRQAAEAAANAAALAPDCSSNEDCTRDKRSARLEPIGDNVELDGANCIGHEPAVGEPGAEGSKSEVMGKCKVETPDLEASDSEIPILRIPEKVVCQKNQLLKTQEIIEKNLSKIFLI